MVADIERTVIYDETVPAIPEIDLLRTRTIITAEDDGFITIEEHQYLSKATKEDITIRIGLTPLMVQAILKARGE
jgi:hypothetical protein